MKLNNAGPVAHIATIVANKRFLLKIIYTTSLWNIVYVIWPYQMIFDELRLA